MAINKLNAKLKVMKCQNARIARKIILKNGSSDQNSQIHVEQNDWNQKPGYSFLKMSE